MGTPRPHRVRFTWEDTLTKGVETRTSEDLARDLIAELERTAERIRRPLSWRLELRTGCGRWDFRTVDTGSVNMPSTARGGGE